MTDKVHHWLSIYSRFTVPGFIKSPKGKTYKCFVHQGALLRSACVLVPIEESQARAEGWEIEDAKDNWTLVYLNRGGSIRLGRSLLTLRRVNETPLA